ncbi:MAG: sarcosine oxidase subunit gamma family protein [Pseudomonadota bacterium]
MSEALVLDGATAEGVAVVREVPAPGMICVKGDHAELASPVEAATGCAMPAVRGIVADGEARVAWMAPDEVLVMVPRAGLAHALADLEQGLSGSHALVADVSDMRAMFWIEGDGAREVLAKLCPVDLAPGVFEAGEMRRTRLAQVPAAFWLEEDGFTLVCFRSVARYVFDALSGAAARGGAVGYF